MHGFFSTTRGFSLGLATSLISLAACTVVAPQPSATAPAAATHGERHAWDGELVCSTSDDLVIREADIRVEGNGPTVMGSCDIIIENSRIEATGVAVLVQGSGDIKVSNSVLVSGSGTAVSVMGSGDVELQNTEIAGDITIAGSGDVQAASSLIRGEVRTMGTGEFEDRGGNQWQ